MHNVGVRIWVKCYQNGEQMEAEILANCKNENNGTTFIMSIQNLMNDGSLARFKDLCCRELAKSTHYSKIPLRKHVSKVRSWWY